MPITYQIDAEAKLIRTKCCGNVTLAEVLEHFQALDRDSARPDAPNVFLDLTEATSLPTPAQVRDVSGEVARLAPHLRFRYCAAVAPSDALYGMLRMFSVYAEGSFQAISVFRSVEQGEAWLKEMRALP